MKKKPTCAELELRVEQLEESEKKYRRLFETAMIGIYRTRIHDGKFLAANQTLARMMGYDSVDQFDLVITDMTMPQMTGDLLVKEILKIRSDIPTILCTGFSEKIDEERAKEIGIRRYIEKPVNRFDLANMIRKVLQ